MPGTAGPNLGLIFGYSAHEGGWGAGAFNPGFGLLDAVIFLRVLYLSNTPPGSPANGDRYIVGTSPTGAWATHANTIAVYRSSAWVFYVPKAGWRAFDNTLKFYLRWTGTAWVSDLDEDFAHSVPTTGTTITAAAGERERVVDPATGLSTLTITLPPNPFNGQTWKMRTGNFITALTINASGATVKGGGPFMLPADSSASWKYVLATNTWYAGS